MLRISSVAAQLAASQEGLSSMSENENSVKMVMKGVLGTTCTIRIAKGTKNS
jgi:hypothetical protein